MNVLLYEEFFKTKKWKTINAKQYKNESSLPIEILTNNLYKK